MTLHRAVATLAAEVPLARQRIEQARSALAREEADTVGLTIAVEHLAHALRVGVRRGRVLGASEDAGSRWPARDGAPGSRAPSDDMTKADAVTAESLRVMGLVKQAEGGAVRTWLARVGSR